MKILPRLLPIAGRLDARRKLEKSRVLGSICPFLFFFFHLSRYDYLFINANSADKITTILRLVRERSSNFSSTLFRLSRLYLQLSIQRLSNARTCFISVH